MNIMRFLTISICKPFFSALATGTGGKLRCPPVLNCLSTEGTLGDWRALDEDFRQTMVEQMSIDRGLDPNDQNPDWLIDSVEDIAEALYLSCDISGACADQSGRDTLGANLITFPDYDEEQGLRNAEAILRMKTGHED